MRTTAAARICLGEKAQLSGRLLSRRGVRDVQLRHIGAITRASVGHVECHAHVERVIAAAQRWRRRQDRHSAVGEGGVGEAVPEGETRQHLVRVVPASARR
jgi:hypothetical protein